MIQQIEASKCSDVAAKECFLINTGPDSSPYITEERTSVWWMYGVAAGLQMLFISMNL